LTSTSAGNNGPAATGPAIRAEGLRKHFFSGTNFADLLRGRLRGPRVEALCGVDLRADAGQVLALMGPNGAGKSTLLRLVAGLLLTDGGSLRVLGQDPERAGPDFRRRVCYVVPDERSFSWRLTGLQNLYFFAALHGLRGAYAEQRIQRVLSGVGLAGSEARRPVREYSSGMRQRLALARGLLGEPEVLLLDEPTRGVDPRGARDLRALLSAELFGPRRTAIVATHDPAEAEQLCGRALALDRGRLADEGPAAEVARGLLAGTGEP
jgi:ABC-2 type transport system ATP-binding protein